MSGKPRPVSLRAEILNLGDLLREYGYAMPELEHLDNPKVLEMLLHPFTRRILRSRLKEPFTTLLADIATKERVTRLTDVDASEKLIDIGLLASGREAGKKARKK